MQKTYKTKAEWLKHRTNGLGGSDASAVVGYSPYKSNVDLWREKTGQTQPADISDNLFVRYGHDAEPLLVKLFALDYPQYEVNYNDKFRVNYNDNYDFIFCTRDADLVEIETGRKGALEIKTTEGSSAIAKEKWNEQIPTNYYCQVLQYFITDKELEFVWVKAQIKSDFGDGNIKLTTKHYYFERQQVQEDIDWLLNEEVNFWKNYVKNGKEPPKKLPNII